uniref:Uncharacterized protein n=1 Tax=Panagrolaimus sp. JU765 TaxID=591449 RepID=A0AC34RQP5_9BILA
MDKFGNFLIARSKNCTDCSFGIGEEIILTIIPGDSNFEFNYFLITKEIIYSSDGFENTTACSTANSLHVSFIHIGSGKLVLTDFPLNLTYFGEYMIVSNHSEIFICETAKFRNMEKCSKEKNNYETKFSTSYRSIYDRLQAYYDIILPFPRRFVGVDYLEGKCKIQFVDALGGEKCGKSVPIDCVSGIKSKAFGVSSVGNNTYQFYACLLVLNNSNYQVDCHVFKHWRFFKAFSYTLKDNCRKDEFQPNDETRMFIGSLTGKSSVLNGIVIISGNSSCLLQLQNDQSQTIFNETLKKATTFGQGYDPIRDKFLSYDDIGFVVPGWKKPVQEFPLFSHGGYIFLKEKEKYQIFSPDGIADEYDLKFSAIIDQPYLDPEIFQ